ncbi:MAG TPA: RNA-binding S4 domain-containing protein, partial [Bacteroidia bacterium]
HKLEKVRIDKYLWAIRIFKTRSLASDACYKGKVTCNDHDVKSSYSVKRGDTYVIKINKDYSRIIEVVDLVDKRGSAEAMKPFYIDHSPPYVPVKREPSAFYTPVVREKGTGRPTKKDRRNMKDEGLFD